MSIVTKRDQLVEELIPFEDHLERLTYVIDRAKDNPGLEEEYKIDTFLIKGCVSQLWVFPSFAEGKCHFQADSEASITKGTASLLCDLYSDESPEDIVRLEPDFLADVGITQHLSPNRRNGLTGVREKIKAYAQMQIDRAGWIKSSHAGNHPVSRQTNDLSLSYLIHSRSTRAYALAMTRCKEMKCAVRLQHALEEEYKIDTYLIKGCVSQLWVFPSYVNGNCYFQADSEASITKGTATLICDWCSGESAKEIVSLEPDFLSEVGITQNLSPNRRNGLNEVLDRIKAYAQMQIDNIA